jgi:hypothetical protein
MTRRRKLVFAAVTMGLAAVAGVGALLAADLYVHHRAERSAGLNRWGYRGPVLGRKQPGEIRVAMLGGSTVFGYGTLWHESIPALLEQELQTRPDGRRFRTINLGFNNEGAFAFVPTLEDFEWLDIDIVALYPGYNDMGGDGGFNHSLFRHSSPVFRLTGYYPLLPLALQEKAMVLRTGGDLETGYKAERGDATIVFRPNLAQRSSAMALDAVATVTDALGTQLDRVVPQPAGVPTVATPRCTDPWITYCDAVYRAVTLARQRGDQVLVVEPPLSLGSDVKDDMIDQQRQLTAMVAAAFQQDAGVRHLDLSRAVDLGDRRLTIDGMHLSVDGNRVIARALVEPVLALARQVAAR